MCLTEGSSDLFVNYFFIIRKYIFDHIILNTCLFCFFKKKRNFCYMFDFVTTKADGAGLRLLKITVPNVTYF